MSSAVMLAVRSTTGESSFCSCYFRYISLGFAQGHKFLSVFLYIFEVSELMEEAMQNLVVLFMTSALPGISLIYCVYMTAVKTGTF